MRFKCRLLSQLAGLLVATALFVKTYLFLTIFVASNLTPRYVQTQSSSDTSSTVSDDNSDLSWFVQLSDVHLSFKDVSRADDLRLFCRFLSTKVGPDVVLLTGDITQAQSKDNRHDTGQISQEWKTYRDVIEKCDILRRTKWLDLRGNHDTFGVGSEDKNLFKNFSIHGSSSPRSFLETFRARSGRETSFIGIDFTPSPGYKQPYNFMGYLTAKELDRVQDLIKSSSGNRIFLGHYPTSLIGTEVEGLDLRSMMNGTAYLCGHLHTLFGLAERMFTRHSKSGLLELELGDWKDNRKFRFLALDQGRLSFVDQKYLPGETNTVILVTNPKDPLFFANGEKIEDLRSTRDIRVLVFSENNISKVSFSIDEEDNFTEMTLTSIDGVEYSPLYTAPWTPRLYSSGMHRIRIQVTLIDGSKVVKDQLFSLDGSHEHFPFLSTLILMMDWVPFTQATFIIEIVAIILILSVFRIVHNSRIKSSASKIRISKDSNCFVLFLTRQVRKVWILSATNCLFIPIIGYLVYMSVFPWALGYVLEDEMAVIFSFGILLPFRSWTWTPPNMTFFYGTLAILALFVPMIIILSYTADRVFRESKNLQKKGWCGLILDHLAISLLLMWQLRHAVIQWLTYGAISAISPFGVGWAVLSSVLYARTVCLKRSDFEEVERIWAGDF